MVVDNHGIVAEGLAFVLRSDGYVPLVVSLGGGDRSEVLRQIAALALGTAAVGTIADPAMSDRSAGPVVCALVDLNLRRDLDGATVVRTLWEVGVPTVVVTGVTDPVRLGEALAAGAAAVVDKAGPVERLLGVVNRLLLDGAPLPDGRQALLAAYEADRQLRRPLVERLERLSATERAVLRLLANGASVKEVATERTVSKTTVRTQVRQILIKLEVHSQHEATALLRRVQWRPDELGWQERPRRTV